MYIYVCMSGPQCIELNRMFCACMQAIHTIDAMARTGFVKYRQERVPLLRNILYGHHHAQLIESFVQQWCMHGGMTREWAALIHCLSNP